METVTPVHGNQKDIKDLAGGALVNFAGKLGRSFRGAFLWVVTLLGGLEIQALYSLSWGLVSIVNRAAGFGLQRGVVRFVVEGRNSDREDRVEWSIAAALTVGSLSSALTVGLVLLSAEWVADFYGKPIAGAVRMMAWSVGRIPGICHFLGFGSGPVTSLKDVILPSWTGKNVWPMDTFLGKSSPSCSSELTNITPWVLMLNFVPLDISKRHIPTGTDPSGN